MSTRETEDDRAGRLDPQDRVAIVEACVRMAHHADRREWDELIAVFTEEVRVDYTSLQGGEPALLAREELVESWRMVLGGLAATQHLTTNHLVSGDRDGDRAVCTTAFQATHVLPNPHGEPMWTLGGAYRYELRRVDGAWRIAAVTMTAVWATGNQQIMALASAASTETTGSRDDERSA